MEKKSLWQCYNSEEIEQLEQVNALYRECLDEGKTERECVRKTIALAKQKGYSDLKEFVNSLWYLLAMSIGFIPSFLALTVIGVP